MAFERDPKKLFPHDHLLKYTIVPLIPRAVTPNMITAFRFVATPFCLWFLYIGNFAVGIPFFLFLALTDALDGTLARLRRQITPWGTFYDPVADKILIGSVILLIVIRHINVWFGLFMVAIELLIILGGVVRRREGKLNGANVFGKTKMLLQVFGVTFLLIALASGQDLFVDVSVGTLALATVFAVISLFTYGL